MSAGLTEVRTLGQTARLGEGLRRSGFDPHAKAEGRESPTCQEPPPKRLCLSRGGGSRYGDGARAADKPNVILLLTDDQGYGDLSCHGNGVLRTPNLDKLHRQSIRFTDFHVAPMCTPTRGQLMSGLDALRNRARHVCGGLTMLRPDVPTMGDIFNAGGYRTGIFGKWHLGDSYPYLPQYRGFQETVHHKSWGITSAADYWGNDYFDDTYYHNGKPEKYQGYCNDVWFRLAMEWIGGCAAKKEPFFCYLPTNVPHGPHFVAEGYAAPYRKAGLPAAFFGMIANLDENVGKLLAMLDQTGLADNTILIFMTDNGGTPGTKVFNAGMRGAKTSLYDGGHRVPCFVRWPGGGLREPADIGDLTTCQDLLPTLIDISGLKAPPDARFDGVSLAGLLRGSQPDQGPYSGGDQPPCSGNALADRMVVVQYHIEIPKWNSTVMWRKWRLVKGEELYDIGGDPGQKVNVAELHPDVVKAMREHYERWWTQVELIAKEPCYVHIGADKENPTTLTCADWYMIYADNFGHLQGGNNSHWNILVERDGQYEFALSRWPAEADTALDAPLKGPSGQGKALPIAKARLKINQFDESKSVASNDKSATFAVSLRAGKARLQTWFYDKADNELCGAYYARVCRK
jgi:arylsulfatase